MVNYFYMNKITNNLGNSKHQIYHEDFFKALDKLIKNNIKVDAIICDMPFWVTNNKWDKKLNYCF